MARFSVPIEDIVDLLGLERSPKNHPGARSIKVHCPFCDHKGYTLDVDVVNCVYHCFHCPDDMQKNTGALDLYSRVRLGAPLNMLDRKKVFIQLCNELGDKAPRQTQYRPATVIQDENIYPADDNSLNAAYSALLSLPYLKLSRKHAENLMERGLPEKIAYKGKFASLPPSNVLIKNHPDGERMSKWYWNHNLEEFRKNNASLANYRWKDVVAGLLIATDLVRKGVNLRGVPGFFHLTPKKWAFRYDTGMLIPTISYEGNIVGIQTRRDTVMKSGLRYMTLSSKGLPDGVTSNIARTHVVHNREISKNTTVLVTEGPLKADIIFWFLTRNKKANIAVIALQGVKNVREIPMIATKLREAGVTAVQSAFDMDKCGNVAVADASVALRALFHKEGIRVNTLVWDEEYALKKLAELLQLATQNGIDFKPTGNCFVDIASLAKIFTAKKIEYNVKIVDGKKMKDAWGPLKGYDDYLNFLSKQ